jgi:Protein of unknown function (DUF616)
VICVYTSIMDGFDNLRAPAVPVEEDVRYICFTNVPNLRRCFPWEFRPAYELGEGCRTARAPKILPHLMLPEDVAFSIYHDGNFQLRQDPKVIVQELLKEHDWAAHRHPCRTCIYDEAAILLREHIGTPAMIEAEIERYRTAGYPKDAGLWANGFIVRRHNGTTAELNERWWRLYASGCERDQLSFPVARRDLGVAVRTIDASVYASPYLLNRWHAARVSRDDNPDFARDRHAVRRNLAQLRQITGSDGGVRYPEY